MALLDWAKTSEMYMLICNCGLYYELELIPPSPTAMSMWGSCSIHCYSQNGIRTLPSFLRALSFMPPSCILCSQQRLHWCRSVHSIHRIHAPNHQNIPHRNKQTRAEKMDKGPLLLEEQSNPQLYHDRRCVRTVQGVDCDGESNSCSFFNRW